MKEDEVAKYWAKESAVLDRIKKSGAQKYFDSLPDIARAFVPQDHNLRCIDEGTPGGIHLAGSGILLSIDEAAALAREAGVRGIHSHEECGAAKIYAENEKLDPAYADEYAAEWAKALAERLAVPYCGHLKINQMNRPSGLHTAVAVYYDGTGTFDYSPLPDLPKGFTISRRYLPVDYAKKELRITLEIAFGNHGFGRLFTAGEPLFVIVLAGQGEALSPDQLLAEARGVAVPYGERVSVDLVLTNQA
ncbi:MAG: hypothetical protein AAB360_03020 [Patescibacteria group bacterium]